MRTKHSLHRSTPHAAAISAIVIITAVSTPAHAQWSAFSLDSAYWDWQRSAASGGAGAQVVGWETVSQDGTPYAMLWSLAGPGGYWAAGLHPTGATSSGAIGTLGPQQVGWAVFDNTYTHYHAGLWNGTAASWIDLNPLGATSSQVNGFISGQQAGYATFGGETHAGWWSGTAASWKDLNPTGASGSQALGLSGTQQVGYATLDGGKHAGLWSGTAASWVDLNPSGASESKASYIAGTQQVGYAKFGSNNHAGLWHGTAASWVDLNPAGATSSQVNAILGTQQLGQATFGNATHAGLWSGTAGSWVDLNPAGATYSLVLAMVGTTQVGYAGFSNGYCYPSAWSGTAASWEPLPFPDGEAVPYGGWAPWAASACQSVWTEGNHLYAAGFVSCMPDTGVVVPMAVLWSRRLCTVAGDADDNGRVDQDDLDIVLFNFGATTSPGTNGDLDRNGIVNQADLDLVLFHYGASCS